MIAFLDVRAATEELRVELDEALARVLDASWFVLGPEVERFEDEWAAAVGTRYAIGVGNGLDAIELSLRAAGIGPGDEVIVPSHTFTATWLAVTRTGASIVPAEVDETTMNLSASGVRAVLTSRSRAIIPVHLYGRPADMPDILDVAEQQGLFVLEDAAQAHGATLSGRAAGSFGQAAAWSFYPSKNLGALGDAGAITTDDADLAARIRRFRNYGSVEKYVHEVAGANSRLDELQAAVLRVKLRHLAAWNDRRRAVAAGYRAVLDGTDRLLLPSPDDAARSSWHLFVIRTDRRDELKVKLGDAGIETLIHYPTPVHRQAAFAAQFPTDAFPVATRLAATVLSLPIGPHLLQHQANRVAEHVRAALE